MSFSRKKPVLMWCCMFRKQLHAANPIAHKTLSQAGSTRVSLL